MKYTSLTHLCEPFAEWYEMLHGSINDWENHCKDTKDVVWSKLYEARSGILVKSYFPDEFEEYREIGKQAL